MLRVWCSGLVQVRLQAVVVVPALQGALRQALSTRFVRTTMGSWCAFELESKRKAKIKKHQHFDEDGADVKEEEQKLPSTFLQFKVTELRTPAPISHLPSVHAWHTFLHTFWLEFISTPRPLPQEATDLVGLPPDAVWACLLSAASLPASLCHSPEAIAYAGAYRAATTATRAALELAHLTTASHDHEALPKLEIQIPDPVQARSSGPSTAPPVLVVLPMDWDQALLAIQRAYKCRLASVSARAVLVSP